MAAFWQSLKESRAPVSQHHSYRSIWAQGELNRALLLSWSLFSCYYTGLISVLTVFLGNMQWNLLDQILTSQFITADLPFKADKAALSKVGVSGNSKTDARRFCEYFILVCNGKSASKLWFPLSWLCSQNQFDSSLQLLSFKGTLSCMCKLPLLSFLISTQISEKFT